MDFVDRTPIFRFEFVQLALWVCMLVSARAGSVLVYNFVEYNAAQLRIIGSVSTVRSFLRVRCRQWAQGVFMVVVVRPLGTVHQNRLCVWMQARSTAFYAGAVNDSAWKIQCFCDAFARCIG